MLTCHFYCGFRTLLCRENDFTPSFTPSLLYSFTPSFLHLSRVHPLHSSTPPLLHSSTPSLLHSSTPPLLHSSTPPLLHPSTPSPLHSSTPSPIHSLIFQVQWLIATLMLLPGFCHLQFASLSVHFYPKNRETTAICSIECSYHFFFVKGNAD